MALFDGDHILLYLQEPIEKIPFVINVNSLMHFSDLLKMLPSYEHNISGVVPSIR